MHYTNWLNGVEPSGNPEVGSQHFLAVMTTDDVEMTCQWVHVDGEEKLGAIYKCCDNGGKTVALP